MASARPSRVPALVLAALTLPAAATEMSLTCPPGEDGLQISCQVDPCMTTMCKAYPQATCEACTKQECPCCAIYYLDGELRRTYAMACAAAHPFRELPLYLAAGGELRGRHACDVRVAVRLGLHGARPVHTTQQQMSWTSFVGCDIGGEKTAASLSSPAERTYPVGMVQVCPDGTTLYRYEELGCQFPSCPFCSPAQCCPGSSNGGKLVLGALQTDQPAWLLALLTCARADHDQAHANA
eukprot:scaffold4783_cov373-Prasinococcus_capsulatus_cf.AAC.8